jgi:hypothetical protein
MNRTATQLRRDSAHGVAIGVKRVNAFANVWHDARTTELHTCTARSCLTRARSLADEFTFVLCEASRHT